MKIFQKLQARGVKLDGLVHLDDLLNGNVRDQEVLVSQQRLNGLDRLRLVIPIGEHSDMALVWGRDVSRSIIDVILDDEIMHFLEVAEVLFELYK